MRLGIKKQTSFLFSSLGFHYICKNMNKHTNNFLKKKIRNLVLMLLAKIFRF